MAEHLGWPDWSIVVVFMPVVLGIGFYFTQRAGRNIQSFFASSRALARYVAGASMIATNFASDTLLWVLP